MTRKQLIQLALDAGFPLPEIMVHIRNIYKEKPNKKAKKKLPRGPRIIYGMNTNAM
jgi:hypothetical protein